MNDKLYNTVHMNDKLYNTVHMNEEENIHDDLLYLLNIYIFNPYSSYQRNSQRSEVLHLSW